MRSPRQAISQPQFETEGHITLPHVLDGGQAAHFFGTRRQRFDPVLGQVSAWTPEETPSPAVSVVAVKQVHGTEALLLDRPVEVGQRFDGGWDALVTNQPGILLAIRTADCVPVLVHDPKRGVVAAIHAGWRGAVAGILPRTLDLLKERFGTAPVDVRLAIGPSVGVCCYEVDEPVLERVRRYPWWRSVVRETRPGKARLDLRQLVARQAATAGVGEGRTALVSICTVCHPTLFYSYRREGKVAATMVSGILLTGSRRVRRAPLRAH